MSGAQHPARTLLEEHVAQAECSGLLVLLRSARLEVERIGACNLRWQLESDLRSRRLVGASEEHGASNHSHQDREDDPDRRNLHFLRAELSTLPDCLTCTPDSGRSPLDARSES